MSRLRLARITTTAACVLGSALVACSKPATTAEFQIGATREEVLAAHGPPARRQVMEKRGEAVWGAIEEFWPSVPTGSSVEIWAYPVAAGSVELYFVDASERVQGKGFAPAGAVFEGEP